MIIIGAISKYSIQEIEPYVESVEKCGFLGKKIMIVYDDVSEETCNYLTQKGWEIHLFHLWYHHVHVQRLRDAYITLKDYTDDEVVIFTDVRDVIFQKNPKDWIEKNMKKDILAFSECIKYHNDPWAINNVTTSFPLEWEFLQHKTSYCIGVVIGKCNVLKDLFLSIFRWSMNTLNPIEMADQTSFNILISMNNFKNVVQFVNQEEGFVTHLNTVWVEKSRFNLLEPTPIFKNDKFYNQNGEEFVIVHQYNRDVNLNNTIRKIYR